MPLRAVGEGVRGANREQRRGGVAPSAAKGLSGGTRRRRQGSLSEHGSLFWERDNIVFI